ncbi:MAG: beta-galactosidase [Myxococcota bacterium]
MQVDVDRHGLRIDGQHRLIRAGTLDYFRIPAPELWRERLERMRAAGLNAVAVRYPWSYHSEAPTEYDFTGVRDVDELHAWIEELGLYLIAQPGPYVNGHLDLGGMPGWLLRSPSLTPRCREGRFNYSVEFVEASREWFAQIVPRFAKHPRLILVQIEHEYCLPAPLSNLPHDLLDLAVRWLGSRALGPWLRRIAGSRRRCPEPRSDAYMHALYRAVRDLGVRVPIYHADLADWPSRPMDVDLGGLVRAPLRWLEGDWRDQPAVLESFRGDEAELGSRARQQPVFYAQLEAGCRDGWAGPGYGSVRERLEPDWIDVVTKAALAEGATLWCYAPFCGGTNWGYMGSPAVYSSYDCGAPVPEGGGEAAGLEAVRRLNEFLGRHEDDWVRSVREDPGAQGPWCAENFVTRRGPERRFVFLRNPSRAPRPVPTPEADRAQLAPLETQIRVYGLGGRLEGISPEPLRWSAPQAGLPPPLPRLERWSFAGASPQLDPAYDDSSWTELRPRDIELGCIHMDALGVHYGFVWYRGVFHQPLDRLLLDARHCYAVWINRRLVAAGDQFRNRSGIGPDGARVRHISLRGVPLNEGRNALVILVESLGHHEAFTDDARNPRGIVRLDTGQTPIQWRYRSGLIRGERGICPVVAFAGVERSAAQEVVLPHGWEGEPNGVGLYETSFALEGVDPKQLSLGLRFDPGRGKANLYLNGCLIGRYWPERGPQRRFLLPWGVLDPRGENHLAVAVWKRTPRAALGKLRLEPM